MPLKVVGFPSISNRWILVGSIVAVVVLAVFAAPMWKPHLQRLLGPGGTRHLYGEGFQDSNPTFYMIKADWCPHCQSAKPKWQTLQDMSSITTTDGRAVTIADPIDGPEADALGLPYKGFPTFVLVKDGNISRCDADRSSQAWADWLQQQP
jgi:thiol-disulfide isomerase/thioredoxin